MIQEQLNSDKELIRKLKKNDIQAFNQLFNSYSSKLYHFAYGYLKSKEESEELVQEVFLKVWEKRSDIKEEFQFRSYLFSIAFNYIKKYFRSKAILNKYIEFPGENLKDSPTSDDVNYPSLKTYIDKLVEQMPEKRKVVFIKSRIEGKSAKDIADEMQLSKSTVENHLNHALNFLRKHLSDENIAGLLFFCLFLQ